MAIGFAAALLLYGCGKSGDDKGAGQATESGSTESGKAAEGGKTSLIINSNTSDPAPKKAMEELVASFKAAHPDIDVKLNIFDHEAYKTSVRNFLTTKSPDVVTWYAGNRMKLFVDRKLLEDVSDIWQSEKLTEAMASALSAMTIDGKQYGVPYTYYQWGVYYRKDIFDKLQLQVPKTWDEFKAVCKALKEAGITPIDIGTKAPWTTAGWFDYLNLRINGMDFHMKLAAGEVPYTDDRVKAVFAAWGELVGAGYFLENHATYSWQEAQAFLLQGKAAMMLLGNFLVQNLPEESRSNLAFFQFPAINPEVGMFEDAPIDTLHIPAGASNKEAARKFLAFAAKPEQQTAMNKTLGQLPVHREASVQDDPFLNVGVAMLRSANGLAQFYDRDTAAEMAQIGMAGFQEFMVKPERLDKILERLEKARARIFK